MGSPITSPWLKLVDRLEAGDYELIRDLERVCTRAGTVALKLELDYKRGVCAAGAPVGIENINEFLYFDGPRLIGYIGLCSFGGAGAPVEVTGMVHPDFERQGVFSFLHKLLVFECQRRGLRRVLLLCDRASTSGQSFMKKTGATLSFSEFEMFLDKMHPAPQDADLRGVVLRKATNLDKPEIDRQNAIYFGDDGDASEEAAEDDFLPEEEEKRGIHYFLAEKDGVPVGKVHLQLTEEHGGIYGLGVLPELRGQGYGRAVLLGAVQKLMDYNARAIMLQVAAENATALTLYQSAGFKETSTMDYFELNI